MNVLQILPELDVGGVERGTVDFARYLTLNGHKAVVVSAGGRLVRRLDEIGARHYELPVHRKSPYSVIVSIVRLCRIISRENIEVIHARSRVPAIIGFFAARITKRVFVTTSHGYYNTRFTSRPMGWGRFVIVASNSIARHMIDDFNVPFERVKLIPRGVDLNEFKFLKSYRQSELSHAESRKREYKVGIISRITPLKGHRDFLKAMAIIARSVPGLQVEVVGEAPKKKTGYREELDLLARRLGISGIVRFLGAREDIPQILEGLDVLVLPTVTPEAFGRTIVEAQAVGVPVVASKVGGIVDIIKNGDTGLFSSPGEPRSIAEAVIKLLKDRELAEHISERARRNVEKHYSHVRMSEETIKIYQQALRRKKILVIKVSALGDVVLSVPSLKALRKKFPEAVIKVLVGLSSSDILRGCPYVDERIVYDPHSRDAGFRGLARAAARLRREDFDISVDLQNNRASHILSFLGAIPLRYGYSNGKLGFLLNRGLADNRRDSTDPVSHQFRTLDLMGIKYDGEELELWPSREDEEWARAFLAEHWIGKKQTLVGINVGSSTRWKSKRWEPPYVSILCDELARRFNIRPVLTGSNNDVEEASRIARHSQARPIISCGKTELLELAALIRHCALYITTDSAPMHIAAAMKVPFIALFGPTDAARHAPKDPNSRILSAGVKCSPCYKPTCKKDHICMKSIKPHNVVEAAEEMLIQRGVNGKCSSKGRSVTV